MKTEEIVSAIIKEQSQIVGDTLARYVATNSGVVKFNSPNITDISLTESEPNTTIQKLVDSYKILFGQASVEVCMSVVKKFSGNNLQIA